MIRERKSTQYNGWIVLIFVVAAIFLTCWLFVSAVQAQDDGFPVRIILCALLLGLEGFLIHGFFTLEPNEAAVLLLLGKYVGTEKNSGFRYANPLYSRKYLSLRVRNFDGEILKVNDNRGNPIEISAIVVWRVGDTAQALFEVQHYDEYVRMQSESALRHLATQYPYDSHEPGEVSLRASLDEISDALGKEIQARVEKAGVIIEEARINHLAYAPEIASAMLQRQQAEAIIAARQKIVDGAVGMVQMALARLKEDGVLALDEERKANMVSNLMVVLCAERAATPVLNTGSLY
ncbi:MAG TPA: SPFH domain-containing protein [bacterium]|nr:SPFH domain-containing protein [bacterium]HQI49016.1 SPFH domain-containing protein [bacterium]HQJ63431.1 SPFH domain-containing protein [bacterium]